MMKPVMEQSPNPLSNILFLVGFEHAIIISIDFNYYSITSRNVFFCSEMKT